MQLNQLKAKRPKDKLQEKKVTAISEVAEAASEVVAVDSEVATEVATKLTDNSMKIEVNIEKVEEAVLEEAAVASEVVIDNLNTDQRLQQLKEVMKVSFTE